MDSEATGQRSARRYASAMRVAIAPFFVVVVVIAAGGCEIDCDTVQPSYAGDASDEAWRVMIDARATAIDGGDASTITVPAEGAELSQSDDAPSLSWDAPLQTAALMPSSSSSPPSFLIGRRAPRPGLFDALSQIVFPRAHAHLPPITSDLHFLEIDVPGRACPVSGLTTGESFVFGADDWAELTAEPGERTMRMMSAFLTDNRITEGPFTAAPVTFSVVE